LFALLSKPTTVFLAPALLVRLVAEPFARRSIGGDHPIDVRLPPPEEQDRAKTLVRILLGALVASGLLLAVRWTMETRRVAARRVAVVAPTALDLLIGFLTNFFDTLGIGSFATTTAVFRLFRLVPDELIPGTIIVGDALPVLAQAFPQGLDAHDADHARRLRMAFFEWDTNQLSNRPDPAIHRGADCEEAA
jgi:hypothetical protein